MFIKKLHIKNFKCFESQQFDGFGVPNGDYGSGLNIFIGENGNGKTTTLEAINYLTLNTYSVENQLSIDNFRNFRNPIEIIAEMDMFRCSSSIGFYKDWYFESCGIDFFAKSRGIKERNKLLSSEIESHTHFKICSQYIGSKEKKDVDSRDKPFSNHRIIDDGLNVFYFDKNRTRQITTGNYKTTFERILEDLNWRFRKNLDVAKESEILKNIEGEFFKNIELVVGRGVGRKTGGELRQFFDNADFEGLKIELLTFLEPFKQSFFALRKDGDLKQVPVKNLGSGIEIVLTLLLLKNIAGESKGKIIYLIDEPELHLHPKAQSKLLEFLLKESADKQIFISTHSPYMFKGAIGAGVHLFLFKRDSANEIKISNARDEGWGIFGRFSPTWGEINWFAYDLPTVEFHNELYGYLEANYRDRLESISKAKKWLDERKVKGIRTPLDLEALKEEVSLPCYIRHSIHHPENTQNNKYTEEELKSSINVMVKLLHT